jgi:hypothetical protein
MHIPPGIDSYKSAHAGTGKAAIEFWQSRYFAQFLDLMKTYGNIVQLALAGHTHMDDFRVLSPGDNTSPIAFRITPAMTIGRSTPAQKPNSLLLITATACPAPRAPSEERPLIVPKTRATAENFHSVH